MHRLCRRTSACRSVILGLCLAVSFCSRADEIGGTGQAVVSASAGAGGILELRSELVRTAFEPNLLSGSETAFPPGMRYVLQLDGPITPTRRRALEDAGVQLGQYVPQDAYVVQLSGVRPADLFAMGFVLWLGEFRDSWKIDPLLEQREYFSPRRLELAGRGLIQVVVVAFEDEPAELLLDELSVLAAQTISANRVGRQWMIDAVMPPGNVAALAASRAVQFVEEAPDGAMRNDSNRWILQSNVSGQTPIWNAGIHGEGQIGGLIDGTIRESSCYFDDTVAVGPGHRKIVAMRNPGSNDSHGTHTAGTIAGDRSPFGSADTADGIAFSAKLSFSNVNPVYSSPSTLYARLLDAHNDGARVHSNSWGDDGTTAYTTWCQQIDQFMYDREDSLVCFAVTNTSALKTPENSTNVLAVGASADTPNQANFCSGGTGPTVDGRRKPEVYAPGCGTVSASSSNACGTASLTGTSMACPAVSGAGLLVRQYFTAGYYPTGVATPANVRTPTAALLKAVLINSCVDMTGITGYPSNQEGWGRVLLDNALAVSSEARRLYVEDVRNAVGLSTNESVAYSFNVTSASQPLRVTLAYTEAPALVNASNPVTSNLDLEVLAPGSALYRGNVFSAGQSATGGTADAKNNVEQVILAAPPVGAYSVTIRAASVSTGRQGYALVATGVLTTACTPPSITSGPVNRTACPGDGVMFSIAASGTAPTYQWRFNGADIGGATGGSYSIAAATPAHAGNYDCVVSNACGTATSGTAVLTVTTPATISGQPSDVPGCTGRPASFSVVAAGSPPLTFQWRFNGADIAGATSDSYAIASVSAASAGSYACVVGNSCAQLLSNAAVLTVQSGGDANCDGTINNFDIDAFVVAVASGQGAWQSLYGCDFMCANDINGDGNVDSFDIDPFVACVVGGSCP